jgi:hypothetical protein
MLTKFEFNKPARTLFIGDERKVRLRIADGVGLIKPTHRPHGVKNEWMSHVRCTDYNGIAVFRGNLINVGQYQLIPTSYGWYTLVPGYSDCDFSAIVTLENVKPEDSEHII